MLRIKQFGDFRIERRLGKGRSGEVYLAIQEPFGREVALKVIRDLGWGAHQTAERFGRETRALAKIEHPHVIPLYAAGYTEGYYYIAMRYLRGGTVAERLAKEGKIPVSLALTWLCQTAWALATAHAKGILHRDVKLENILLEDNTAFLSDFGLASLDDMIRITAEGQTLGTPLYLAPEQFERSAGDTPMRDVYCLGVAGYWMLTGRHPFVESADLPFGEAVSQIQSRIREPLLPPSHFQPPIPQALDEVILRCLAANPNERYQDGSELLEALKAVRDPSLERMSGKPRISEKGESLSRSQTKEGDTMENPSKDALPNEEFWTRSQAEKAQEILHFIYSIRTEIEEVPQKARPAFRLVFDPSQAKRIEEMAKEISTVAMIVRCFEVGKLLPTEMYLADTSPFPTDFFSPIEGIDSISLE